MSDVAFWVVVGLLTILFAGEPDLQDSLMRYVDQQCQPTP
jgi:hypothetical protein